MHFLSNGHGAAHTAGPRAVRLITPSKGVSTAEALIAMDESSVAGPETLRFFCGCSAAGASNSGRTQSDIIVPLKCSMSGGRNRQRREIRSSCPCDDCELTFSHYGPVNNR